MLRRSFSRQTCIGPARRGHAKSREKHRLVVGAHRQALVVAVASRIGFGRIRDAISKEAAKLDAALAGLLATLVDDAGESIRIDAPERPLDARVTLLEF